MDVNMAYNDCIPFQLEKNLNYQLTTTYLVILGKECAPLTVLHQKEDHLRQYHSKDFCCHRKQNSNEEIHKNTKQFFVYSSNSRNNILEKASHRMASLWQTFIGCGVHEAGFACLTKGRISEVNIDEHTNNKQQKIADRRRTFCGDSSKLQVNT